MNYKIVPLTPLATLQADGAASPYEDAILNFGVTHLVKFDSNMLDGKFVGFILRDLFGPGSTKNSDVTWVAIMYEAKKCLITNPEAFESGWVAYKLTHG